MSMHRRAFYAYASVYVMAVNTKQRSFHSRTCNKEMWIMSAYKRKGETVITMQTNYIF